MVFAMDKDTNAEYLRQVERNRARYRSSRLARAIVLAERERRLRVRRERFLNRKLSEFDNS